MGDTFIISGLKEKRSAVAGLIVELRGRIERLQVDLFHLDEVLGGYGLLNLVDFAGWFAGRRARMRDCVLAPGAAVRVGHFDNLRTVSLWIADLNPLHRLGFGLG